MTISQQSDLEHASRPNHPRALHHYTLYVTHGHVLAKNARHKLIDLGTVDVDHGKIAYRLDAGGLAGSHFDTTEKALQDLAAKLAFAYLDDQFTSLPDVVDTLGKGAGMDPYLDITLEDVTVHEGDVNGEKPAHIF